MIDVRAILDVAKVLGGAAICRWQSESESNGWCRYMTAIEMKYQASRLQERVMGPEAPAAPSSAGVA